MLNPRAYAGSAEAGYAREPALHAMLAGRGIPTPANSEAILGDDGRLAAVAYDHIEGVTVGALGRAARAALAREVAAMLTALHAVPVEEPRALGVPEIDLGEELYRPMVEASLPRLGPRGRTWLEQRFAAFIGGGGSRIAPRVLVHGDLACSHLLAGRAGGLAGVIDWAEARIADPAYDFAALIAECPRTFAEQVIAGYGGPASGDPDMRRRATFYVEALPVWEVRFGVDLDGQPDPRAGVRRIAARAGAEARRDRR